MGQKINPFKYRLGITRNWVSRWFPSKHDARFKLEEDVVIRRVIEEKIEQAGIVRIEIERGANNAFRIFIKAARPGLIIGRGGKGIEELSLAVAAALTKLDRKYKRGIINRSIKVNVEELKRSEISAQHLAQLIAWDMERRLPFRRVMKKQMEFALQNREVQGVKVRVSGRLDGNEISRVEWLAKGKMPLQSLRADIDYGEATSYNSYGTVGVKAWIYKGDVFTKQARNNGK